jgi:hypothetical protein
MLIRCDDNPRHLVEVASENSASGPPGDAYRRSGGAFRGVARPGRKSTMTPGNAGPIDGGRDEEE